MEEIMRLAKCLGTTVLTLFTTFVLPIHLAAQVQQAGHLKHYAYKLVDLGTLGGPNSYNESIPPENIISLGGVAAAYADTLTPDPYFPNCANPDCFVSHAISWQGGIQTDLGALPGGPSSFASSINARGEIVGASQNGQIDPLTAYPETLAVLWKNDIFNLGTLGGNQSVANAINDRGQVVGAALNAIPDPLSNNFSLTYLFVPAATQAHAFLWTPAEGMQDLGTLGGPDSAAAFVNLSGQISGQSYTNAAINPTTGYATLDPFFWEHGKMLDIGTLGGTFGYSVWMNSHGQVVGVSNLAGDQTSHAFLWGKKEGLKDLGTLGGSYSEPDWINDAGAIVGGAYTANDAAYHAFLWRDGVMTDLGSVADDTCSEATSINSLSQIVGFGSADCQNEDHAFLSENGGPIIDLATLVLPGSDLTLIQAIFINDQGEIAARGKLSNGDEHAVVLIPCDGNHPFSAGCSYNLVEVSIAPGQSTQASSRLANSSKLSQSNQLNRIQSLRAVSNRRLDVPGTPPKLGERE